MSNIAEKTSSNVFYKARYAASSHNEQLSSREGAADIMSIDRGRLYRIESGIANPYPEEVHLMSDLYNAPELRRYYCKNMCPLGTDLPDAKVESLDRIGIKALSSFRKISAAKELLLDITEDGIITEDERPDLDSIIKTLDELSEVTQSLKVWAEKNLSEVK